MKELESFHGHQKDVTALAWHPFQEEYFVSGSFDGSIFHWLIGHDTPQVEITGAHENSVWDLAWHPIGNILCSGSNDHTTRFWCRYRPGDTPGDNTGYNQGFGEASNFPIPDGPSAPGPFTTGLPRIEGIIPGIGVAMPLSIPSIGTSDQGEQQQSFPVSMPVGAPPLPPGPHPSLLARGQSYQQFSHHIPSQQQQHQPYQQQIPFLQVPPSNMPQMQPQPSHLSLVPHSHLSRPSLMVGSFPMPSMSNSPQLPPMSGQMGMQGSTNQMVQPMPQGHMMGMNQMHSGSVPANALQQPPHGGYASGMPNIQGPSALDPQQVGNQNWTGTRQVGMHMGLSPGMLPPPPPPPPPPQQQQQQHGSIPQ
ncbi:hypothetical protein MKW98_016642 [Papaver atlanticum]|uniref:Flowering time control protein FY n=1 Tax=Papaver atlanticum TaxID=357466 RepID=A0AAD4SQX1_9MAGN|nr:hypothetical protein MKW98_016642 [Papaver atlanticum]